MLPKKKRWTAAIRSSSPTSQQQQQQQQQQHQPSVPPTIPSPVKNQWTTHSPIPNPSSRSIPRHQTPPTSTVPGGLQPISVGNVYQTAGLPVVSSPAAFVAGATGSHVGNRSGGGAETGLIGSKQFQSFPIRSTNDLGSMNHNMIPISASLITAITNSAGNSTAELLQQRPELLLQILPQEYVMSCAQNIAKMANNSGNNNNSSGINNAMNNNHLKTVLDQAARALASQPVIESIINSKPILVETGTHPPLPTSSSSSVSSCSGRSSQPLSSPHRSDASDFSPTGNPITFHTSLVANNNFSGSQQQHSTGSRQKAPDPGKLTRTATPGRSVLPQTNSPVFSNSTSSVSSRFSPNRRLSSGNSTDNNSSGLVATHTPKLWSSPAATQPPVGQQPTVSAAHHPAHMPTVFDLSTLSAATRQAGLLSSPSSTNANRMGPPNTAAFLSQWDSATQLAFLSQNRDLTGLTEACARKLSAGLLAPQPVVCSAPATSTAMPPLHSGNGVIECSSASSVHRFAGSQHDSKTRVNSELLTNARLHTNSSPIKSGQDGHTAGTASPQSAIQQTPLGSSRRQSIKPNSTGPSRASDLVDHRLGHPMPNISTGTTDSTKPYRATPPWLGMDGRSDSQPAHGPSSIANPQSIAPGLAGRDRINIAESADTRFAILQDAKMAALNVDWPTPPGSLMLTSTNKVQRMRSSSSFCASVSPNLVNNCPTTPASCTAATSSSASANTQSNSVTRISSSMSDDNRLNSCSSPSTKPGVCTIATQPNRYTPVPTNPSTLNNRTPVPTPPMRINGEYGLSRPAPPAPPSDVNLITHHKPCAPPNKPSSSPSPASSASFDVNITSTGRLETGLHPASRSNNVQPNQIHLPYPSVGPIDVPKPSMADSRSVNSSMPLKKRLIQRYEADNVTGPGADTIDHPSAGRWSQLIVPSDSRANSPRMYVHSPISPVSQNSPFNPPATGETKPPYNTTEKLPLSTNNSTIPGDKVKQSVVSGPAESSKRKGTQNKMTRNKSQSTEVIPPLPPPPSTTTTASHNDSTAGTNSERRQLSIPGTKRAGGLVSVKRVPIKGARKMPTKANANYARTPKSGSRMRTDRGGEKDDETGTSNSHNRVSSSSASALTAQQRRRRPADGTRRARRNSSSASSVTSWTRGAVNPSEEAPRRRMAAVNGTLLMMVAARAQRSNSSASASSCSTHSIDADASNDEAEEDEEVEEDGDGQNTDSVMVDDSSHSIASSTASSSRNATTSRSSSNQRRSIRPKPRPKVSKSSGRPGTTESSSASHNAGTTVNSDLSDNRAMHMQAAVHTPESSRTKKPKRAAALAASAATAASATVGAKRPRTGSKRPGASESKRGRRIRDRSEPHQSQTEEDAPTENEDMIDDESARATDDASSEITTVSRPDSATVSDELTAALMEEKIPIDELLTHLPGPPNLARLTDNSLHPAHSLDYYKRNQTPFVQLVSCNDPGLKQVPKCRACRQLKVGAHFDASVNGESGLSTEDSSLSDTGYQGRGAAAATPLSIPSARDGQFKRPNGRNSQPDKPVSTTGHELDRSRERDKSRSKKMTNSGSLNSSSTAAASSVSASDQSTGAISPVSVFCRFWGFRKLAFNNRGLLKLADFCHSTEASPDDRSLWEMHHPVSPPLSVGAARYILERSGMLFCRLLRQELAILTGNRNRDQPLPRGPGAPPKNPNLTRRPGVANSAHLTTTNSAAVAWKRPVKGVREMCDVCETTMFNTHWVCGKCGYSVCVHCCEEAKTRQKEAMVTDTDEGHTTAEAANRDRNKTKHSKARGASLMGWSSCTTTRQHHDPERLLLTALLPACTIGKLLHRVHRITRHYQIRLGCGCLQNDSKQPNNPIEAPPVSDDRLRANDVTRTKVENSSLDLLADLALQTAITSTIKKSEQSFKEEDLRDGVASNTAMYDRRGSVTGSTMRAIDSAATVGDVPLPPHTWIHKPDPHSSPTACRPGSDLADGDLSAGSRTNPKYRVLQLHQPDSPGTMLAFQHEWRQNRPVIVSGCQNKFDSNLWSPRRFAEDFGSLRTPLVDCATGMELTRYPLRTFWEGFERKSKRLTNKDGRALCLKLKDWPTTDDFAELQPNRFADLMNNLPMPEYTSRDGQLNLASRLASFFVCPDLGPKLYVAYGTGGSRSMGTTNLHVDIADAINLLLYVGHPSDSIEESTANAEAVLNVMRLANVDRVFLDRAMAWNRRVQSGTQGQHTADEQRTGTSDCGPPGALWHIFLPEDMPALREFLTQITEEESGAPLEPGSDPIHDQLFYLDQPLLDRLYACTGVLPCTIVQFRGDTIFIPAGAAHQVRNLNSCIKAAVDFVSPEHLPQCFQLIEEFRRLSNTHQNHEDKLQVKNMLFHAVKDALSVLLTSSPPHPLPLCKSHSRSATVGEHGDEDVDEEEDEDEALSAYDCSISNLFDAERLASAQLIRPSLLIKPEELSECEQKPIPMDKSPVRTLNRSSHPPGTGLNYGVHRNKSGSARMNKTSRARLPTAVSASRSSSPLSRIRSPARPNSAGSDQLGSASQIHTPSPPSTVSQNGSSGVVRLPPTSSTGRGSLYDTQYLMDAGLTHRNGTERDFVVSGSQLG